MVSRKITLSGYIIVPPADLAAVRECLPEHLVTTRAEAGCLTFNVVENVEQEGRFEVYEAFIDQTAFEYHQSRARESKWGLVAKNIKRHYTVKGLTP